MNGNSADQPWKMPPLEIRRELGHTLVEQIACGIKRAIETGYYRPGEILPPMRMLEKEYGVSRIVTSAVLAKLAAEGLVLPRKHVGAVVLDRGETLWKGTVLIVQHGKYGGYYINSISAHIRDKLVQNGYLTVQCAVAYNTTSPQELALLDVNIRQHLDLAILIFENAVVEKRLSEAGIPFVVVGEPCLLPGCVGNVTYHRDAVGDAFAKDCVQSGIRTVTQFFFEGHGFRYLNDVGDALKAAGISSQKFGIPITCKGRSMDYIKLSVDYFSQMLADGKPDFPDLFYFEDDHIATGALLVLATNGIRIPEDVKVVSWANAGDGPAFSKSVARIEIDPIADGEKVMSQVLAYLSGKSKTVGDTILSVYHRGETFPVGSATATPGATGRKGIRATATPGATGQKGIRATATPGATGQKGIRASGQKGIRATATPGATGQKGIRATGQKGIRATATPGATGRKGISATATPGATGQKGSGATATPGVTGRKDNGATATPGASGRKGIRATATPRASRRKVDFD